jgi:polysaccharide export outer membrane protein
MKKTAQLLLFLLAVVPATSAQNEIRSRITQAAPPVEEPQNPSPRGRTIAPDKTPPNSATVNDVTRPVWGNQSVSTTSQKPADLERTSAPAPRRVAASQMVKPTSLPLDNSKTPNLVRSAHSASPTSIYRVGIGDVLDVRLANLPTRESTLFTVMKNGTLEHPLLARPLPVAGLTPDEIARRLSTEIKVIKNPRPSVSVRDYASHSVLITGAVDNPGRKILRREAMPLFTLLAEALPRAEAATVTVSRNGKETNLALGRNEDLSLLVMTGDVIRVSAAPAQFVYVAGEVASAGEKQLREGMTLTQLLLVAGGVRSDRQVTAKIFRRDAGGFLRPQEYKLKPIEEGKAADPVLQAGDRIEVRSGM